MKVNVAVFVIFALLCGLFSQKNYAQASLQEIVRFNIPVGESFCSHVEAGGDINGDGRPDLVFSCIDELHSSNAPVYIFYSVPDSNAIPDQILSSPYPNEGGFGYSIAYKGDLNGDGISDLVIGIKNYDYRHSGALLVYYGGDPTITAPDVFISGVGLGYTHSWDLFFSEDMITDCDLNGDGINDLLVYAPGPQYENWGNVYVFLGGEPFSTTPALHIRGSEIYEYLGSHMKSGDFNGDGYDDIVLTNRIPVSQQNPSGPCNYSLKIYPGGDTLSNIAVYDTLIGTSPDLFVTGVIANGDLNGDGFDDIIISCGSQNNQVLLKVIYGQSDLTGLVIQDYILPDIMTGIVQFYCNLDNDLYSDFCINHRTLLNGPTEIGNLCIYKQTGETIDLSFDYINSGDHAFNDYGWGYSLGDMNEDEFPDLFVFSYDHATEDYTNYATLLSEYYVSVSDDLIHPASSMKVYCNPNPFWIGINISFHESDKTIQLASIKIFNVKGQLVYNKDVRNDKQVYWDGFDKNGILTSSGIYVIKVSDSKGSIYTTKAVKLK